MEGKVDIRRETEYDGNMHIDGNVNYDEVRFSKLHVAKRRQ